MTHGQEDPPAEVVNQSWTACFKSVRLLYISKNVISPVENSFQGSQRRSLSHEQEDPPTEVETEQ